MDQWNDLIVVLCSQIIYHLYSFVFPSRCIIFNRLSGLSRLLPSNPWRKVAQDSIKALDATRSISADLSDRRWAMGSVWYPKRFPRGFIDLYERCLEHVIWKNINTGRIHRVDDTLTTKVSFFQGFDG